MFRLKHEGTVAEWTTNLGGHILFPHQLPIQEQQGGLSVSAPVYGLMPDTDAWSGACLPKYGLVCRLKRAHPISHQTDTDRRSGSKVDDFDIPIKDTSFPWDFRVRNRVEQETEPQRLTYGATVIRSSSCLNQRPMPCQLALRPYFATHGGPFRVMYQGRTVFDSENDLSVAKYFDIDDSHVVLETCLGTITFGPICGFDRVYVSTDNPGEYVCVEPTTGIRTEHLLEPRKMVSGSFTMMYRAKQI